MTARSKRVSKGRTLLATCVGGPYAKQVIRVPVTFDSSFPFRAKGQLGFYVRVSTMKPTLQWRIF
jgi:hypothetical protein